MLSSRRRDVPVPNRARRMVVNLGLAVASTVGCLVVVELALRAAVPAYRAAANGQAVADDGRIWRLPPGKVWWDTHRDTGRQHWVVYDRHGTRHHRHIAVENLRFSKTVAFFGDSYLENNRLPVQHTVPEILNFLLEGTNADATVLNFGVEGYGLDQEYLTFRSSALARRAGHVMYFFCHNDVRNVFEHDLFSLDQAGRLVRRPLRRRPVWLPVVSRLCLTYVLLDMATRAPAWAPWRCTDPLAHQQDLATTWREWNYVKDAWGPEALAVGGYGANKTGDDNYRTTVAVMRALLRRWRSEVEAVGGTFTVVLLPYANEQAARGLFDDGVPIIDLKERFTALTGCADERRWTLKTDEHWNEEGNQFAAVALYGPVARLMGLEPQDGGWIRRRLGTWYGTFDDTWRPTEWVETVDVTPAERAAIRGKYLGLEPKGPFTGEQGDSMDDILLARVKNIPKGP